jgi:predicted ATPase
MSEAVASFTKEHTLSERSLREKNRERKKRVVVTGGSGRLGRCVVREMVEHGWEVYNRMCSQISAGAVTDMYS